MIPATATDPVVEFVCRIPAAASKGARLDWPTLCRYGVYSAPQYRAYLAVAAAMDWTAFRGAPIARMIGAPVVDASGRTRYRGGRVRRRADVLVAHPNAQMVPRWSDADAARFIGLPRRLCRTCSDTRRGGVSCCYVRRVMLLRFAPEHPVNIGRFDPPAALEGCRSRGSHTPPTDNPGVFPDVEALSPPPPPSVTGR